MVLLVVGFLGVGKSFFVCVGVIFCLKDGECWLVIRMRLGN